MIGVGLDGGSQWESNVTPSKEVAELQIPENGRTDTPAKTGRRKYSGVQNAQPRKRDGIGLWLEYQKEQRIRRLGPPEGVAEWGRKQTEEPNFMGAPDWSRVVVIRRNVPPSMAAGAFCASRDAESISNVVALVGSGDLKCTLILLPDSIEDHPHRRWDLYYLRISRAESEWHLSLKVLALAWLRSIGAERASTERPCVYGSADAYSTDIDVAVECGDTAAARVLPVAQGELRALLVLPFGVADERGQHGFLFHREDL